ncbi:MAG: 16S rRNA (cytidine(1402)-2'-O)-methyltransferase [Gemmatimonadota bacterium]
MEPALYVVATPIGNLSDLSARAEETLRQVSVVYAEDTRRTGRLLKHLDSSRPLRSLHAHNEAKRIAEVLARLADGETCALVTDAGTPAVSDPGRRLVEAVTKAGYKVSPIPGPSAVLAALSVAGMSGDRFTFLGFPPRRGSAREEWIRVLAVAAVTAVFFESPRRISGTLADLEAAGLGTRRLAVCRELTKLHEDTRYGTVSELAGYYGGEDVRGEVTVVVEGAASTDLDEEQRIDPEILEAAARDMATAGMTRSSIAQELRQVYGISRNEAYRLSLNVKSKG